MMLLALVMAASSSIVTYDCELAKPLAVTRNGDLVGSEVIGFPNVEAKSWKFAMLLSGEDAVIDWPGSPMQLHGKAPLVSTAKGAGVFILSDSGPCLFTETACSTTVQFAEQRDHGLKIIVTPAALATDSAADTREPFLVMIDGHCVPRKIEK